MNNFPVNKPNTELVYEWTLSVDWITTSESLFSQADLETRKKGRGLQLPMTIFSIILPGKGDVAQKMAK